METKPTYQELETMNARLTDQLSKALTEMATWQQRAINAERKVAIAKIELQNEIDRLTLTKY
jgi:hypothetical protein